LHGINVNAALVRKCRRADPRLARIVTEIGDLVYELRKLAQFCERTVGQTLLLQLEGDVGNHTGKVAVSCALAVAIDRALNVRGAAFQSRQRIRHA